MANEVGNSLSLISNDLKKKKKKSCSLLCQWSEVLTV